jgi:hypothetical protein
MYESIGLVLVAITFAIVYLFEETKDRNDKRKMILNPLFRTLCFLFIWASLLFNYTVSTANSTITTVNSIITTVNTTYIYINVGSNGGTFSLASFFGYIIIVIIIVSFFDMVYRMLNSFRR